MRSHDRRSIEEAAARCKWSFGYDREAIVALRRSVGDQRRWWRQSTATISDKEEGKPR
ncbi:hypothetical protein TIFTF001_017144 [Ficus carica]|uniref:Uncharacterized protein n=1 Tax=Ficus carica TaxID=3494 RepID=A0AA88A923_FICCA|nr:hypothetical protein TIFTF001_017144 [Ficus carica]